MAYAGKIQRVLIIVENNPVPFDQRVWAEARALRDAGYEVSVISPMGKGFERMEETLEGISVFRYPAPPEAHGPLGYLREYGSALFWEAVLAVRIYRQRSFHIVHACNPPDNIFIIGGLAKLFAGCKFIFDHHDLSPELYEAKFGNRGILYRFLLLLERATFYLADVSIATNESYREIAIRRGKMRPKNVFVVRNGPDLDRVRMGPVVPILKHGKHFLIGYVGIIARQEGIDTLLEVARIIVRDRGRSDVHFTIIGDGPDLERMKTLADKIGVAGYTNFTGRVSDDELLATLNSADVCVNPDSCNELNDKSTMIKIMEYMALGKPVVQFDLAEGRVSARMSSLYAERNNLEDFADKIIRLLDDYQLRRKMGRVGRRRIERELAWTHQVPQLLAAYEAVLARLIHRAGPEVGF